MKWTSTFLIFSLLVAPLNVFADPHPAKTFASKKSKCVVKKMAREYPDCFVYKGKKKLLQLDCDGGVSVLFSPSGKYIALGGSDIVAIYKDNGLAVYNCESEKISGYLPTFCESKPNSGCDLTYYQPTKWLKNESALEYSSHSNDKNHNKLILKFGGATALP